MASTPPPNQPTTTHNPDDDTASKRVVRLTMAGLIEEPDQDKAKQTIPAPATAPVGSVAAVSPSDAVAAAIPPQQKDDKPPALKKAPSKELPPTAAAAAATATAAEASVPSVSSSTNILKNRRSKRKTDPTSSSKRSSNSSINTNEKSARASTASSEERLTPPTSYRTASAGAAVPSTNDATTAPASVPGAVAAPALSRKEQLKLQRAERRRQTSVPDHQVDKDDEALLKPRGGSFATTVPFAAATTVPPTPPPVAASPAPSPTPDSSNYLDKRDDYRPPKEAHDFTEDDVSDFGDSIDLADEPDEEELAELAALNAAEPGAVRIHNNVASAAPVPPPRANFMSRMLSNESKDTVESNTGNGLVAATAVSRNDIEEEVRNTFLHNVVQATQVQTVTMDEEQVPNSNNNNSNKRGSHDTLSTKPTREGHPSQRTNSDDNNKREYNFCCCRTWCGCGLSVMIGCVACSCVFLIGIIVGTSLLILAAKNSDLKFEDDDGTSEPTLSPDNESDDEFSMSVLRSLLKGSSPNPDALDDESTPQYAAFLSTADYVKDAYENEDGETDEVMLQRNDLLDELTQRYALLCLYFSTTGEEWFENTNWSEFNTTFCDWYNVVCDPSTGKYVEMLDLSTNNLVGPLVPELAMLPKLKRLNFANNQVGESLDMDIADNTNPFGLRRKLQGSTATENAPHVALPPAWSSLSDLEEIQCGNCGLHGTLPEKLADAPKLKKLLLRDNDITGVIPNQYGRMDELVEFGLRSNLLIGTLPSVLSLLPKIEIFDVSLNQFTGDIPDTYREWTSIKTLNLDGNKFLGNSIEDVVCAGPLGNAGPSIIDTLLEISADCDEISCSCCTKCCSNEADGRQQCEEPLS